MVNKGPKLNMRTLISILLGILTSTCPVPAATWVFHAFQDNFYVIQIAPELRAGDPITLVEIDLDFGADLIPGFGTSGIYWWGYNDNETIDLWEHPNEPVVAEDVPDTWRIHSLTVAQGFPEYNGSWQRVSRDDLIPGEYWVDFDSDGSYRVSASEPADFGKWAWDGSINPSWAP